MRNTPKLGFTIWFDPSLVESPDFQIHILVWLPYSSKALSVSNAQQASPGRIATVTAVGNAPNYIFDVSGTLQTIAISTTSITVGGGAGTVTAQNLLGKCVATATLDLDVDKEPCAIIVTAKDPAAPELGSLTARIVANNGASFKLIPVLFFRTPTSTNIVRRVDGNPGETLTVSASAVFTLGEGNEIKRIGKCGPVSIKCPEDNLAVPVDCEIDLTGIAP